MLSLPIKKRSGVVSLIRTQKKDLNGPFFNIEFPKNNHAINQAALIPASFPVTSAEVIL